ncbi:MAG: glycosyltransferase [Chloroflexi bacterium]|nr:glycosyltransferase [Chloroflexota bacterium]
MKIVYSLPHPADSLSSEQAGHTVRASAILGVLEKRGHEIIRVEAARGSGAQTAVKTYRSLVKKLLPRFIANQMRDRARVAYSLNYAGRLQQVVEQARPDVILETHIAFSLAGKTVSEKTGIPLGLDDVAPSWEEAQQYGGGAGGLAQRTHHEVTQQASLVVAVSQEIRRLLKEDGVAESKLVTISNGIDHKFFQTGTGGAEVRARYGIPADTVVIVFVGSFQPYHRVDLLLEAFAQVKTDTPARLLLVGEGQRTPEAKAAADRLGINARVTFTGRIPYDQVAQYVAAGDVATMPATNSYGNPMKIYEYMAQSKAIIAPDQPTITEIVAHGESAYLFQPENVGALAAGLKRLIEDGGLRTKIAQRARADADQHTWEKRGEAMEQALEKIRRKS